MYQYQHTDKWKTTIISSPGNYMSQLFNEWNCHASHYKFGTLLSKVQFFTLEYAVYIYNHRPLKHDIYSIPPIKTRHSENHQLYSNVCVNQSGFLIKSTYNSYTMSSHDSIPWLKINTHICSVKHKQHASHSSLFLFILHADSAASASLSICHSLLTTKKTLRSFSSSLLSFFIPPL